MMLYRITEAVKRARARAPDGATFKVFLKPVDFALMLHEHAYALDQKGDKSMANFYRGQARDLGGLRVSSGKLAVEGAVMLLRESWEASAVVAYEASEPLFWVEPVWAAA